MNIYKYNSNAKYNAKYYNTPKIDFSAQTIYINITDSIKIRFPDLFTAYDIIANRDKVPMSDPRFNRLNASRGAKTLDDYFMYFRCQLNFAIFCATTALGISYQHLTQGSPLMRSVYKFHVYYHIHRILKQLEVPLPHDVSFKKFANPYKKASYFEVCSEYGVDTNILFIRGGWYYEATNAIFGEGYRMNGTNVDGNYCSWMLTNSQGLTSNALNLLSDSVRAYVYLILSSQASARSNIIESPAARQIYIETFDDILHRRVDTAADIIRYQEVLKYARSKIDFAIAAGVYMLPSNMLLRVGKIEGYNNKLMIADSSIKIGIINRDANLIHTLPSLHHQLPKPSQPKIPDQHHKIPDLLPAHHRLAAEQHQDEKTALILIGVSLILIGIYFFK